MKTCLDSWAVLEWLRRDGPAAARVDDAIYDEPGMSWVNVVEVAYRLERSHGRQRADQIVLALRAGVRLDFPDKDLMMDTARLKAVHAISLADCFAIATAARHRAPLLTGDPEIVEAEDLPCTVVDLRAAA